MEVDETLAKWIVGAVAAGILALLGFLSRWVFNAILQRIEDLGRDVKEQNAGVVTEIRAIAATTQDHAQRLLLGNQAFQHLHDQVRDLQVQMAELQKVVGWKGRP